MKNLNTSERIKEYEDLLTESVDVFGDASLDPVGIPILAAFAMEEGILDAADISTIILPLLILKRIDEANTIVDKEIEQKSKLIFSQYCNEINKLPKEYRLNRCYDLDCMFKRSILNGIIFGLEAIITTGAPLRTKN